MKDETQLEERDERAQSLMSAGQLRQALPGAVGLLLGVGVVLVFGPNWGTFLGAAALVCFVFVVQKVFGTQTWREREEDRAGAEECPECGSLQTDLVNGFNRDGSEYEQMHCFACDAEFGEKRPID